MTPGKIREKLLKIKNETDASQILPSLIEPINKLSKVQLLKLFEKPANPVALITTISKNDTDTALWLLGLFEKLPDNNLPSLFYEYRSSFFTPNNLIRQISRFSPPVVIKTLNLLKRLPAEEIYSLLNSEKELWTYPFTRDNITVEETSAVAVAFIDTMNHSYMLRPLLLDAPNNNSGPFLHMLASHQILPAISHYLQKLTLQPNHTNANNETAFKIAEKKGYDDVISLFKARHFFHKLLTPERIDYSVEQFEKISGKYPGVLATRWHEQKTLAHIALDQKNLDVLALLLRLGTDPNTRDEHQLSLLDYAINNGQAEVLTLLTTCPKTIFTDIRPDGSLPLAQLFGKFDYPIVSSIIKKLHANPGTKERDSFAATLMQLPKARVATDRLKQALENPAGSFQQTLVDYCNQTNDSLTFFLLHTGSMISVNRHDTLLQTAQHFVANQLRILSGLVNAKEKEAARLQIITLFFSMTADALSCFLKSLTLDADQIGQLDLTLCHALIQPLVYASLKPEEQLLLIDQLHNQQDSLESIALIHFAHTTLTDLHPAVLQKLSQSIPKETLYLHSKQRRSPSLVVLALNEELSSACPDQNKLSELFANLEKEIERFNQGKSSLPLAELHLMLNLATHPQVQDVITKVLSKQTEQAPIRKKMNGLFAAYRKDQPFIPGGMLRNIYMNMANMPDTIQNTNNQAALADLLAIADCEEVQQIINSQQHAIRPHLLAASLLTCTDKTDTCQLSQQLYLLGSTIARQNLTPLVNTANVIGEEARALASMVDDKNEQLKNALNSLAGTFNKLTDALIASQFDHAIPAWTTSLNTALDAMLNACDIANEVLNRTYTRPDMNERQNPIQQRLAKLIQEQAKLVFPEAIKQAFYKLDAEQLEKEESIQKSLANKPALQSVFQSQKTELDVPAINMARACHRDFLNQHIKEFNDCLRKGIAANPAAESLWPAVTSWQAGQGAFVTQTSLITQIPDLMKCAKEITLKKIGEQNNHCLLLMKQSEPLLTSLQRIANSQSCMNDLLDALYATDMDILTQFIALTDIAQIHDLNRLARYVLNGKMHHWPVELLKNGTLDGESSTTWLRHSLTSLTDFASSIVSAKALLAGLYRSDKLCEKRLNEFSSLITDHKLPLTSEAIILFATSHAKLLAEDLLSKPSQLFVQNFSELMHQSHTNLQNQVFNNLPAELHQLLLGHVLSGIGSKDPRRAAANRALLTNLCQQAGKKGHESQLQLIKKRLGAQDFGMLGDDTLVLLAKDVLSEKLALDELTFDGVWIQRLLVSPKFVSACSPETLQHLTERYRALSLTLKQDEFERLNNVIAGKFNFANQHGNAMTRWQKQFLDNPELRQQLLAKRERLLMFRADDSIRALYNQLEDNCFELRETDAELADKALNTLYTHHNQQLSSMRSDVLFRMANFIYSHAMRGQGDLPQHKNPLLAWIEKNLPHDNFQQAELARKSIVCLYDENKEQIAWLDESNHVMTLVNDQPLSLLGVGDWKANSPLYDKDGNRLGVLTASGQLMRENLFQKHTSALLVANMPIDLLEKSPAALELLIQDICTENSLTTLYKAADNAEKLAWVQEQVSQHLQEKTQTTPDELIESFVAHHPIESILDTLGNSANPDNAERLFKAVLANDAKREALFTRGKSPLLKKFFKNSNREAILTNILENHHNKPWFHQILAVFVKHNQKQGLLGRSLQKLKEQTLSGGTLNAIIQTLISNDTIAKIVLQEGSNITRFFNRHLILPVIITLNARESLDSSAQYQLLLMILKAEHEKLFPSRESGQAEQFAWNSENLQHMTAFATRHLRTGDKFDKDGAIRQRLLGELVFRCANFGQVALFYNKSGKLDTQLASSHLQRSYLDALAAQFYCANYAKERLEQFINTLKNWFGSTDAQDDEDLDEALKDNPAIIDWKALAKASWAHTNSTELPLIAAFLINYSGASTPVYFLLQDIFNDRTLMENRSILHHIAQIMGHHPHRDISHVIFKALLDVAMRNPKLIDETILENLVSFHAHAHLSHKGYLEPLEAKCSLITHLGQQKQYALAGHIAQLAHKPDSWWNFFKRCVGYQVTENEEINTLFGRAITEAQIESELQTNIDSWFFGIQKFFKRWWHYGTSGTNNPTGIIKFCDDESVYTHTWDMPAHVRTPISGGQVTAPSYTDDYQGTLKRYQAYMNKEAANDTPKGPGCDFDASGPGVFGFFAKAKEVLDTPVPVLPVVLGM